MAGSPHRQCIAALHVPLWAMALAALLAASASAASAQPITNNDFAIDAVDGPVLGSSREVGMAGAFTAIASGAAGAPFNPAAFVLRESFEVKPVAWDLAFSFFFPGIGGANDFFNNGRRGVDTSNFHFADVGLRVQFHAGGGGALVRTLSYSVPLDANTRFDVSLVTAHAGLGYALLDGQLALGVGLRINSLNVSKIDLSAVTDANDELVSFVGTGVEVGFIYGPEGRPYRIGATLRSAVDSRVAARDATTGVTQVAELWLPRSVHLPWELEAGFAWQLGPRPLNARYLRYKAAQRRLSRELEGRENGDDVAEEAQDEVEREAYVTMRSLPRPYVLLSGSVLLIGPTEGGVGLDAFLEQQIRPRGRRVSFGLRIGAEAEVVPDWLKLRAGTYVEPGRQADVAPRPHVTGGMQLRMFTIFGYTLAATVTIDGAARYADLGVGIGVWR